MKPDLKKLREAKYLAKLRRNRENKARYKADPIYHEALKQQNRTWHQRHKHELHEG